jgi:hypothetical protein
MALLPGLEVVLTDVSSPGKRRHAFLISLFPIEHVMKLFQENLYDDAINLLPWALIMRILMSDV